MNGATDWIPEPFCHPKIRCGIIRRRAKTRYCYFLKTPRSQKSRPVLARPSRVRPLLRPGRAGTTRPHSPLHTVERAIPRENGRNIVIIVMFPTAIAIPDPRARLGSRAAPPSGGGAVAAPCPRAALCRLVSVVRPGGAGSRRPL